MAAGTLPATLRTERLELRRWRVADVGPLLAAVRASLDELRVWMPWARAVPTAEAVRALVEASRERFDRGEDHEFFLFEPDRAARPGPDPEPGGNLVGAAALHRRAPGRAEVGYWVRSDRHRRGYATEAVAALTSAAFRHLPGVGAVEVRMDRANVASAGVPAKLGFALAGEEDRDVLTPGQSGRGLVWRATRRAWEEREARPGRRDPGRR